MKCHFVKFLFLSSGNRFIISRLDKIYFLFPGVKIVTQTGTNSNLNNLPGQERTFQNILLHLSPFHQLQRKQKMIENISLFLLLSAPALPSLSEYLGLTKVLFIKVNPPWDSSYHFHIWRRLQSVEVGGGEAVREGWCDINYPAVQSCN